MPKENGGQPGADDSAETKSAEQDGNAAGKNAGSNDDDEDDDEGGGSDKDDKAGVITFKSQAELNALIQRRVDRATKKIADDAKLTKEQILERERDEALKLVRERDLKDDFELASGLDKAKAARLFRMYRDDFDVDDKGRVLNMKDVLKSAKADFPELFKVVNGKGDGGSGSGDGSGKPIDGDMNATLRKMAGRG